MNDKRPELPRDHGWAWVVCFASFLCMFVMGTSIQAVSVLFLELVHEFDSSVTLTSLTVTCYILTLSISSVVSTSVIIPKFGERPVIVASGLAFSLCSVGYFLAPNIIVFIVFAGGKGTCMGMIFVPCVSLLSHYFSKRRSLASTICNSGICVASIVTPPIIRALTAEYGMRGTFLILGAVELHLVTAGLLMRPVSSYRSANLEDCQKITSDEELPALTNDTSEIRESSRSESSPHVDKLTDNLANSSPDENNFSNTIHDTRKKNNSLESCHISNNLDNEITYAERKDGDLDILETDDLLSEVRSICSRHSRKASFARKSSLDHPNAPGSSWGLGERSHPSILRHESMQSVAIDMEPALAAVGFESSAPDETASQNGKSCCCRDMVKRIFDPSLFRQWSYRVFLISCVPSASTQFLLQYIPTIAVMKGATKDQAATLVTIIGAVDLASRLAVGIFADTHFMKAIHIVILSQACQGIVCQFNLLFDSFHKLIAMVVVMGLFIGTRQSLMAMMHIEIVGMQKMARCLSVSAMVGTISAACHSPVLSAVMEATGSYTVVLHYVGLALVVGAGLMFLSSFLSRNEENPKIQGAAA